MICLELFWTFFKIGLFTFGGGYAMLPLIQSEVAARGWMGTAEIVNFVAVSESTPGPFAVNISTYIGRMTAGIPGAICATLGVVLPSFVIIRIVSRLYDRFRSSRAVEGLMSGLRPTVIGLIAASLLSIGRAVFAPEAGATAAAVLISAALFAGMSVLAFKKKHPVLIILLSAAVGIAAGYGLGL